MKVRWIGPVLTCAAAMAGSAAMATREPPRVVMKPPEPPVEAAPQATTEVGPVEVTTTLSPAALKAASRSFVRSYAATTARLDQIPRWREPICLEVSGGTRATAALFRARFEPVAKLTGQALAREGCSGNVAVYLTDDPQGLVDNLAADDETFLGYYHRSDFKRLKTVTRPIQAWYVTATGGPGGPTVGALLANVGRSRYQSQERDDPDSSPPTGCADSRLSGCLESEFRRVVVVVDGRRTARLGLELVADYTAMLVFSQPKTLDRCAPLPSILDLFADCPGRGKPRGLTRADRAYLSGLYSANLLASKASEQADIAERMTRALVKAQSETR